MRVERTEIFGFAGSVSASAGLFGLWGWPAAALFAGALLLALSVGAAMARKG